MVVPPATHGSPPAAPGGTFERPFGRRDLTRSLRVRSCASHSPMPPFKRPDMNIPEDPKQIRRMLAARLERLIPRGPVVTTTVVQSGRTCGRFGCRCYRGEKHIRTQITYKEQGRTRSIYVPVELVDEVKRWAAEGRRLRRLMKEINQLAIALIRAPGQAKARRRQRR